MRVIADHLRAMTFLIADGVVPSNEWRGYVLRKIMRRAMRHGKKLGFKEPVLHALVDVIVAEMGAAYPELKTNHDAVVRVVRSEEERFDAVLTAGLPRLEEALDRAAATGNVMPGDEAFRLYDSLGVPLDFMEDLAGQRNITIDREGYERAMEGQRVKARAGSAFKGRPRTCRWRVTHEGLERELQSNGDRFEGYDSTRVSPARQCSRSSTPMASNRNSSPRISAASSRSDNRRSTSKRAARSRTQEPSSAPAARRSSRA